jgi:hypothetical protein
MILAGLSVSESFGYLAVAPENLDVAEHVRATLPNLVYPRS